MTTKSSPPSAKERILEAAASLFARRGYHSANIDEIVQQSGTSKGSFYFHFLSKEKMALGLVEQLSERLVRRVESSIEAETRPLHRISSAIEALLLTFSRQRRLAQILLVNIVGQGRALDKKFLPARDQFAALIQRELDGAVTSGALPPMETVLVSHVWLGGLHEVILRWLMSERSVSLTDQSRTVRELLLRSIGVEPGHLEDTVEPSPPVSPSPLSMEKGKEDSGPDLSRVSGGIGTMDSPS